MILLFAGAPAPDSGIVYSFIAADCPEIAVEVDFATPPTSAARTWTNVTAYVRQLNYTRGGRQNELQQTQAGQLSMLLDNRDARFDPSNGSSPYSPGVKRMRWIRVMAKWDGVEYPRWTGLVETWNQNWPEAGRDATCTVTATDAFKILALYGLVGESYTEALSGVRVADVLTTVGVPFTAEPGSTLLVGTGVIAAGTKALDHLQQVAQTENGLLYADADGTVVFEGRHHRVSIASLTATATIGDGGSSGGVYGSGLYGAGVYGGAGGVEIPYSTGELDYSDAEVWPTVTITPVGGTPETAFDADSRLNHFDRTLELQILSGSQTEALQAAQYLSQRYADPAPRIPQVSLLGRAETSWWPTILATGNSDRFTWTRRAASTVSMDVFVEQVAETVIPGTDWQTSLQLSPAGNEAYWLLGVTGYSELGLTTRLGY